MCKTNHTNLPILNIWGRGQRSQFIFVKNQQKHFFLPPSSSSFFQLSIFSLLQNHFWKKYPDRKSLPAHSAAVLAVERSSEYTSGREGRRRQNRKRASSRCRMCSHWVSLIIGLIQICEESHDAGNLSRRGRKKRRRRRMSRRRRAMRRKSRKKSVTAYAKLMFLI